LGSSDRPEFSILSSISFSTAKCGPSRTHSCVTDREENSTEQNGAMKIILGKRCALAFWY